jgi:hypothetical protein
MNSPSLDAVDSYLDQLFDRLAGTGRRGRRILAEAEDHLLHAVDEAHSRGVGRAEAEAEAVARFGDVRSVLGPGPATSRWAAAARSLTMLWLLIGAGVLVYGLSGALTWLASFPYLRLLGATNNFGNGSGYYTDGSPGFAYVNPSSGRLPLPVCTEPDAVSGPCWVIYQPPLGFGGGGHPNIAWFLGATAVGSIALAALWLASTTARAGLPAGTPPRSERARVLVVLLGLAAAVLLAFGVVGMTDGPGTINGLTSPRALADVVAGLVCAAAATLTWLSAGIRRPRRRRA